MEKRIDIEKLVAAIHEVVGTIKTSKKEFRDPSRQPPKWETRSALWAGKSRATILCSIRAHARKNPRVHLQGKTLEQQAEMIAPFLDEFALAPLSIKATVTGRTRCDVEGNEPPQAAPGHDWVTLADGTKTLRAQRI